MQSVQDHCMHREGVILYTMYSLRPLAALLDGHHIWFAKGSSAVEVEVPELKRNSLLSDIL